MTSAANSGLGFSASVRVNAEPSAERSFQRGVELGAAASDSPGLDHQSSCERKLRHSTICPEAFTLFRLPEPEAAPITTGCDHVLPPTRRWFLTASFRVERDLPLPPV
jgi:hypothetical protein